jgi:periplasmic protein TonB
MRVTKESLWAFAAVVGLHFSAVGFMVLKPSAETQELVIPTLQGILIPAPPAEIIQAPKLEKPPEPEKPQPRKIEPKPEKPKKMTPKPPSKVAPSKEAITPEKSTVDENIPPPPVNIPSTKQETLAAPTVPPREDADNLNNPRPAYPHLSRRLREQGAVVLEVLILANGKVGEVRIKESSGFKRLDDTAIKAVKNWKYLPARRGGIAIDYWYLQPLEFSLN